MHEESQDPSPNYCGSPIPTLRSCVRKLLVHVVLCAFVNLFTCVHIVGTHHMGAFCLFSLKLMEPVCITEFSMYPQRIGSACRAVRPATVDTSPRCNLGQDCLHDVE